MRKVIEIAICDVCKTENHLKPEQISNLMSVKIPVWRDESLDCEGYIQKHIEPVIKIKQLEVCPECLKKIVTLKEDMNGDFLWKRFKEK